MGNFTRFNFLFSALMCLSFVSVPYAASAVGGEFELTEKQNKTIAKFYNEKIRPWTDNRDLLNVIIAQNEKTAKVTQDDIDALEKNWSRAFNRGKGRLLESVLENAGSDFLTAQVAALGGVVSEVFVMDAKGLNVAASMPTQDYWQGDEAKYQETYLVGPDAFHVSKLEYNPVTHSSEVQISVPVVDKRDNKVIGAMTISVIADILLVE